MNTDADPRDSVDRHVEQWRTEIDDLDPLHEGLITRMQMIVKHLRLRKLAGIEEFGLGYYEFETLHMLGGCGPEHRATPKQIAEWLQMSPAAITGRLDMLERRRFIHREPAPDDRRSVLVSLTPAGLKAWRAACRALGEDQDRLLESLSHAQRSSLDALLRRMLWVIDRPGLLPLPGDATAPEVTAARTPAR